MAQKWRNTTAYRNWRNAVLERDNYKCVLTGLTTNLHAHHLNHSRYFPEQRLDVENGVTLHRTVHRIFHYFWCKGYRKKCVKKDFTRFRYLFKYIMRLVILLNKIS